nr:MAG TPA: hypothetical protein [Microviridae sp.]
MRAPDEVRVAESRKHPSALEYISLLLRHTSFALC